MTNGQPGNDEAASSLTGCDYPLWRGCIPRLFFADPGQSTHGQIQAGTEGLPSGVFSLITQLTGDHCQGGRIDKEMAPADASDCIHSNQHGCVKRDGQTYRPEEDDIWRSAVQDSMEENLSGRTQHLSGKKAEKPQYFRERLNSLSIRQGLGIRRSE